MSFKVNEPASPLFEHCGIDVGQDDMAVRAHLARKLDREIPGAASQVKHVVTGSRCGLVNGVPLPEAVQAGGHQVIHDVVACRDRVEHIPHVVGFFADGHIFIAEMSGFDWGVRFVHDALLFGLLASIPCCCEAVEVALPVLLHVMPQLVQIGP